MGLFFSTADPQTLVRLSQIERKLDAIIAHLNIALPADSDSSEYRDCILANRKIEAIKRYRERTGASLAESKNAIEELARAMNHK